MTIHIEVARANNPNNEREGTFKQPWPLVIVQAGTPVRWRMQGGRPGDTFVVSFSDGSPFENVTAVNEHSDELPAINRGTYHYQVYLTDGDTHRVYPIHRCPAMGVD